jgi:Ca2+-binding RTX toxin-like protein
VSNVETVTLGDAVTSVTVKDSLVAGGQTLTLSAANLSGTNSLTWDGSAESNGSFNITGSAQDDNITGGAGADTINSGDGNDTIISNGGGDGIEAGLGDDLILFGSGDDLFRINLGIPTAGALGRVGRSSIQVEQPGSAGLEQTFEINGVTVEALSGASVLSTRANIIAAFDFAKANDSALTNISATAVDVVLDGETGYRIQFSMTMNIDGGLGTDTIKFTQNSVLDVDDTDFASVSNIEVVTFSDGTNVASFGNNALMASGASNLTINPGSDGDTFDFSSFEKGVTISASDGDDVYKFGLQLNLADIVDGGTGYDELQFTDDGDASSDLNGITNIENIILGDATTNITTLDDLVASGGTLAVTASALSGNNSLNWDASAETDGSFYIIGSSQNDTIITGAGNDIIDKGLNLSASDTIDAGAGTDELQFTDNGESRSDLDGVINVETITLGDAATKIITSDSLVSSGEVINVNATSLTGINSLIWDGNAELDGSFHITGSINSDEISGGSGNDVILGGAGSDFITGGFGSDILSGGDGSDTFNFSAGSESTILALDTVSDFVSGEDKFDFTTVPDDVITSPSYAASGTGDLIDDIGEAIVSGGPVTKSVVYVVGISGIGEGSYLFYDENGDNQVGMNELVLNLGNESDTILSISDFI